MYLWRVKSEPESKSKVVLNSVIPQILVKETAECSFFYSLAAVILMTGKKIYFFCGFRYTIVTVIP